MKSQSAVTLILTQESLRDSQYAWLSHKRKLHQSRKRQRAFRLLGLTTARNEVGAR